MASKGTDHNKEKTQNLWFPLSNGYFPHAWWVRWGSKQGWKEQSHGSTVSGCISWVPWSSQSSPTTKGSTLCLIVSLSNTTLSYKKGGYSRGQRRLGPSGLTHPSPYTFCLYSTDSVASEKRFQARSFTLCVSVFILGSNSLFFSFFFSFGLQGN